MNTTNKEPQNREEWEKAAQDFLLIGFGYLELQAFHRDRIGEVGLLTNMGNMVTMAGMRDTAEYYRDGDTSDDTKAAATELIARIKSTIERIRDDADDDY